MTCYVSSGTLNLTKPKPNKDVRDTAVQEVKGLSLARHIKCAQIST